MSRRIELINFIGVKVTRLGLGVFLSMSFFVPTLGVAEAAKIRQVKSIVYFTKSYNDQESNFKSARNLVYSQLSLLNQSASSARRMIKVQVEQTADIEGFEHVPPDQICGELAHRLAISKTLPDNLPISQNIWQLKDRMQAELVFIVMNTRGATAATLGQSSFSCDGQTPDIHEKTVAPYVFIDRPRLGDLVNFWDN